MHTVLNVFGIALAAVGVVGLVLIVVGSIWLGEAERKGDGPLE